MRSIAIGIRRETKNRWECRAPLTPTNIRELRSFYGEKLQVIVQPCSRRVFSEGEFRAAGAIVNDNLGQCDLILGVKEVPIGELQDGKHYIFFSHTHKGQPYNMPLLKAITEKRITLLDYELLTDNDDDNNNNRRLVAFGSFAGYAGMINALHGLGDRLLTKGYRTPFLNVALAHNYASLNKAKAAIEEVGNAICAHGLPAAISPIVFLFTGTGNVSMGAQAIFKLLPHEFVPAADLPRVCKEGLDGGDSNSDNNKRLIGCVVTAADYARRRDGGRFSFEDYYERPEEYESVFHEQFAPYATVIVNGIYWDTRFPRLLTREQALGLRRLEAICDISCDIHVSSRLVQGTLGIDRIY